jgi:hypothetical protein
MRFIFIFQTYTMSLIERYQNKPLTELVKIVESARDYQPEAVETAKQIIRDRKLDQADILKASREVISEKINAYLQTFSPVNDKLMLPTSHYLNEEEVKLVFKTCFTEWKHENDDMIPDGWKYVLAAGFG